MSSPPVLVWNPKNEELVRCWLAFKELRQRGHVIVGFGSEPAVAAHKYWGTRGTYSDKKALDRLLTDPYDFLLGYNFGFDIMTRGYACVEPAELPAILLKQDGRYIDDIVGTARITAATEQLIKRRALAEEQDEPASHACIAGKVNLEVGRR